MVADVNFIMITGIATKDAVLRRPSGVVKAEFSMEVARPFFKADGKPISDLFLVDVYGPLAEQCAQFVKQGSRLVVIGTLNKESFVTRTGRREHLTVIKAKFVKPLGDPITQIGDVTIDELRRDIWGDATILAYITAIKDIFTKVEKS
ncbi:MAG: single-stranded DNA-binding protein [Armatimonadota bacterium]|nr:single-stranded DNA-binding protein [Armatimonadota bacterium]